MKPVIEKWLQFAKSDLDSAEYLLSNPKANVWTYLLVAWHCHQAIEKILKAIIIHKNKELLRIHDLPKLLSIAEIKITSQQKDFLLELNQYYLTSRYPDLPLQKSYPKVGKKTVERILQIAKSLFLCLKEHLN